MSVHQIIITIIINLQLHFVHTKQIIPHDLIFSWDSAAFADDADVDEDEREEDYEDGDEDEEVIPVKDTKLYVHCSNDRHTVPGATRC